MFSTDFIYLCLYAYQLLFQECFKAFHLQSLPTHIKIPCYLFNHP